MIVGCLSDRCGRGRIEDGLKGWDRVQWFETFAQLLVELRGRPTEIGGLVIGSVDAARVPPDRIIAEVRHQFPGVPILGYCGSRAECMDDIRRMSVAGVHQLLLDTVSDSRSIVRAAFESTRRRCAAGQVFDQIKERVPTRLWHVVRAALDNPGKTNSVVGLARQVGVDRKTLRNWCEDDDFLPPGDLLQWSRLLLAAALLNWSNRSVASVALELEYPSDNALRVSIRRRFGVTPSAMKRGGVDRAVRAFERHLDGRKLSRSTAAA